MYQMKSPEEFTIIKCSLGRKKMNKPCSKLAFHFLTLFKLIRERKGKSSKYPKSFSLINLHEHVLKYSPPISHGAEADCLALLRITAVIGDKWLVWVKNNSSPFSETKSMWTI